VEKPKVNLPEHPLVSGNYQRPPRELSKYVDDYAATLIED
jgi:polyphosphate kinase